MQPTDNATTDTIKDDGGPQNKAADISQVADAANPASPPLPTGTSVVNDSLKKQSTSSAPVIVPDNAGKRVLLVEPSSTMRHVLSNYIEEQGFEVETLASYAEAATALKTQFDSFDSDYDCMLLGWPVTRDRDSSRLLGMLEGVDYHDLPVVVLSQDMRADSRAWVAARDHSVMLRWKDYRSAKGLMESLLDQGLDENNDLVASKFSNDDIRILVVDDSASIRFALRDLLQLHGYHVSVVGTSEEGVEAARNTLFDIALLDYYLQEATGDELCRALIDDPATGNLICTILTGTYSDHIIKRSLKAGAIECMFKNESSELLLARIDALSRLVRQRNLLTQQREDMNAVIRAVAGSVMVFDTSGVMTYANDSALEILGHADNITLLGQSINTVNTDIARASYGKSFRGLFKTFTGSTVDVLFKCSDFKLSGVSAGTIVVFRTRSELESADATSHEVDQQTHFLKTVSESRQKLSTDEDSEELLTFLMLDVGYAVEDDEPVKAIGDSQQLVNRLTDTLRQVYQRNHHVAYLGDSKFGILLHHNTDTQAFVLTRKIMQITNDIGSQTGLGEFSSTGALLRLDKNRDLSETEIIQQCQRGLRLVESRGRNNALLLDLRRVLPVYPKTEAA